MANDKVFMDALEAIAGSMATAYVTLGGVRYRLLQLKNFEASMEISVTDVPILGKTGKGHKPSGWNGTWKGTAHYNQSVLREVSLV